MLDKDRYKDMLNRLFAAQRLGVRFELERVRRALRHLGEPQERVGPVILVGGTNGKGSTAAMIESCLRAEGFRTGLFTSPHLARFTERFLVAGREVEPGRLLEHHDEIRLSVPEVEALTFFELATLLAVLCFAEADTEVTVLEVGMGGRLDATNAMEPLVSVVTGVALDHQDMLGHDIESIAREKAGIFRQGRPAIIGAAGLSRGRVLLKRSAVSMGACPVVLAGGADELPAVQCRSLTVRGRHQRANACCAMSALDALSGCGGPRVTDDNRLVGLASLRWPGRLETLEGSPPVLLDAAHNPQAASALAEALGARSPRRLGVMVGVSEGKDAAGVLEPVLRLADHAVLTQAPGPRAMAAEKLAAAVGGNVLKPDCSPIVEPDPHVGLRRLLEKLSSGDCAVVYGSLFLIGAIRSRLLGEEVDPVPVRDPGPASSMR